jgi:hypothetical protein
LKVPMARGPSGLLGGEGGPVEGWAERMENEVRPVGQHAEREEVLWSDFMWALAQ